MHRFLEDLLTVREIARKKGRVKTRLQQSRGRCRPGLWYLEGPYARHRSTTVPAALRDAIRGIRKRQLLRELVERAVPPWHAHIADLGLAPSSQCSIAYLSNGGNWKLFDLEQGTIWTRAAHDDKMAQELSNMERFGRYFNVPAWNTFHEEDGQLWRRDEYVSGTPLSQCSPDERTELVKVLFQQYECFAAAEASAPAPEVTHAAIKTILECAPRSLPARVAGKYRVQMHTLADTLRLLPAHGDLSGQNVLVRGGQPWIIDWDNAGQWQPMLQDVLYLMTREAELRRVDLLKSFLGGSFDAELLRLFALNGLSSAPCNNLVLLVHAYLVQFHNRKRAGHRDADRRNVDSLWEPLLEYAGDDL